MNNPLQSAASTPKTMTDMVYGQLREDIIHGQLAPDSKLKIEHLRKDYGVGATPIREALSRLSSDGFVVTEGQRGFRVAPISLADLNDVTDLRVMLELKALRKSMQVGGEDWESGVVAAYYQLSKVEENILENDPILWERRNKAFHDALISACNSRWLLHFYSTLYDQHKRYRSISLVTTKDSRDPHSEHERIYKAALARDVETVCKETELHIRRTADSVHDLLSEQLSQTKD